MSIAFQILGQAGGDNAVLLHIDSGQSIERLLFDCGEGCISELPLSEIQAIDHLFFSHLHMDHVAGFDSFFRCVFNRETKPNRIWGPPDMIRIFHHRFQGFLWNLHEQLNASWQVSEIHPHEVRTARYELREAFSTVHDECAQPYEWTIFEGEAYTAEAITMDHRTPSMAYIIREKPRQNVDTSRLAALGLRPGPWLKSLKEIETTTEPLVIDGIAYSHEQLRKALLVESPGDSFAYLTDFLLNEPAIERLAERLHGVGHVVCEGQYRHSDLELAEKNFHTTTIQSATLAQKAQIGELYLFHLSARYERRDWLQMLHDARTIFPNTYFPAHWNLDPLH